MVETLKFYSKYSFFHVLEQFEGMTSTLAFYLTFPFYVWVLTWMWNYFNSYQGNFSRSEVITYVAVTELLFFSFLRPGRFGGKAQSDFSIALARPRHWLGMTFSSLFAQILTNRLLYCAIALLLIPPVGATLRGVVDAVGRLLVLLPLVTIIAVLVTCLFVSAKLFWEQTEHFVLPMGKIFLALGGVVGPLADFTEPWRSLLVALPSSDWFFQVGYFCVKGHFFGLTFLEWTLRISLQIVALFSLNVFFYLVAKRHHQSYGG